MMAMLLDDAAFRPEDFASLEVMLFGGAPASDRVVQLAREMLPHTRLFQGFGQTETNACGTIMHGVETFASGDKRLKSAGQALRGVELKIAGEDGRCLPEGEAGEIWLKTPSAMLGYLNKPEQTATTLIEGWIRTGDVGRMDGEGHVYICDRLKDMIISGGENVFSAEVEAAIATHAAVAQVAVIGIPDEHWGERVHAIVVPKEGETLGLDDIASHCRHSIAAYKIPRSMDLRTEPLPLSAVGKVLKTELRRPYWREKAKAVN
jgi:acyl-CoA synthetase (AMP-forming)/AMP-acid ligase II